MRCGPCSPSEAALSAPTCGCDLWPTSSTTSARAGRPASSTARRSGFAARLSDARTGTSSSPARTSRTSSSPWSSRTAKGRVLWCSPARPASRADITHARQLGLVRLLADEPAVEIFADAGYQGLGAQTGGRVMTPPHRKFKKNAPDWYEEMHERQRKAHSSRRIRVEHGIAQLKNWRALARHLGPPRAHERHHPGRRRSAVPSADLGPDVDTAELNTETGRHPRRLTATRARAR
ncbi:transposase family protein [Streptomyces sp. CS113]|uniref:transposase family protein n=1 Tax=Streptomyces sp. CS113 TaxID=1982761 RepID=UPI002795CE20|nr:transposase family protein [Streptomyces sp. CS113]